MATITELDPLFSSLNRFDQKISLDVLIDWIAKVDLPDSAIKHYARFHPDRYLRNLIVAGPSYHALLICWRSGQRSPIHDHLGSGCAVKVIRGLATETLFDEGPNGMIYATGSTNLGEGEVCASEDSDIHQVSNLQPLGTDLITLHLYSPPLLTMQVYSLVDPVRRQFFDPINEDFHGGAGI